MSRSIERLRLIFDAIIDITRELNRTPYDQIEKRTSLQNQIKNNIDIIQCVTGVK